MFDIFTKPAPRPGQQKLEAGPLLDDSADLALAAELLEAAGPLALRRVLSRAIAGAGVLGARVARSPKGPLLVTELERAMQSILAPRAAAPSAAWRQRKNGEHQPRQRAQQLRLHGQGQFADFVEEQHAAVGQRKCAVARWPRR